MDSSGKLTFMLEGKQESIHKQRNKEFLDLLENYFQTTVNVPRVKHGKRQEIESVINEEAMFLASSIRGKRIWEPRIVPLHTIAFSKFEMDKMKTKIAFQPFFNFVS